MPTPTSDQVHIPTAIGNKKGSKPVAKARMDDGDDTTMSKKAAMGKVPPQFLPQQKGGKMPSKGKAAAAKGKPFAKKK